VTLVLGRAYSRNATLELIGETIKWRAQRGELEPIAENIVTTIRDVRDVRWIERRWSLGGLGLALFAGLWIASEDLYVGIGLLAIALLVVGLRLARPHRLLVIELDGHRLSLDVQHGAARGARELASEIDTLRRSSPTAESRPLPLP